VLLQSFIQSFKIFCFISSVARPILTLYRLKNFDIAKKMFFLGYSLKHFFNMKNTKNFNMKNTKNSDKQQQK